MVCAFYRGGYRYCFNATPHHCAHHQRCGQSPPQGHPNTTLLGFRVALRRRAGFKTIKFGGTWHHAKKLSAAQKRNMGQQLQKGIMLSIARWHALASGTPGPCVSWNSSCWMKALLGQLAGQPAGPRSWPKKLAQEAGQEVGQRLSKGPQDAGQRLPKRLGKQAGQEAWPRGWPRGWPRSLAKRLAKRLAKACQDIGKRQPRGGQEAAKRQPRGSQGPRSQFHKWGLGL